MSANCAPSRTENVTAKTARAARWYRRRRVMSIALLSALVLISGATGAQAASGAQPTAPTGAGISTSRTTYAPPGKVSNLGYEKYGVHGSVKSAIFYQRFQLTLDSGGAKRYTFDGDAGGLSSAGVSGIFGTMFTDDLDTLVRDTVSFAYLSSPGMFTMDFFDDHSKLLGTLVAGNVGVVIGIGGGAGYWN